LQVFTHGLTGYRFRSDSFYLNPSLPPQLGPDGVIIHGMKWQGGVFDVQVGLDNTTITRLPGSYDTNSQNLTVQVNPPLEIVTEIQIASGNAMQGMYPLSVNDTLTVPTRRPDLNTTVVPGNLAQCKPIISSNQTTFPGQYPVAAVDSSNGTAWQPSLPSPAYIIVDLESPQSLSGVHINWGDVPALSFEVLVSNDTSGSFMSVLQMDVDISAPYNETQAALVELVLGNTTDAQISANGR